MTQPNPRDRITMEQAKKVPYFDSKSDLIQGLFDLNEAMINMGRSNVLFYQYSKVLKSVDWKMKDSMPPVYKHFANVLRILIIAFPLAILMAVTQIIVKCWKSLLLTCWE